MIKKMIEMTAEPSPLLKIRADKISITRQIRETTIYSNITSFITLVVRIARILNQFLHTRNRMSGRAARIASRGMPESSGRSMAAAGRYEKDVDYEEEVSVSRTPDGGKHKEKCFHKHKEISGGVVAQTETTPVQQPTPQQCAPEKQQCNDDSSSWGCMWLVWIILIFIIILIIIMAVFWAVKPSFVTRECEDANDGCEVDLARAALYAFVITFFLILIGCAIWCCCRR
ncbi:Hypothetical protein POVR2_LOCUS324 [uncultured virus]|nr:Hypothetical protein POVR2_LOCUS324 [uncultured virus]